MHTDPRHGVVNENCRVHGIENLYVAGGSVFPTSGATMVTVNIVALAVRLADHLLKKLA
jgi:choline dehydrogenase-like flavoprotein